MATGIFETVEGAKRRTGHGRLGKYLGIFTDRVEVGLDQKVMDLLEAERRRAAGPIVASMEEDSAKEEAESIDFSEGIEC